MVSFFECMYHLLIKDKCLNKKIYCKQVEKSSSSSTLHRSSDPSTYPAVPGTPTIVNVTESTITLTWSKSADRPGSNNVLGYNVEYFSPDLQTGWIVAAHRIPQQIITVKFPLFLNYF